MRFFHHFWINILLLFLFPISVSAQFYVTGDDWGRLKWNEIKTNNYSVIYPKGCDSLARDYAYKLEKYRTPIGLSTSYFPGGEGRKRMPVVLHTYSTDANGSVAWAPKRIDLYTVPDACCPTPMPWSTMLAIHESRHVSQMQFGYTKAMKPFTYIFGEMWNYLVSYAYQGMDLMEGDAVIMETALTKSGRGRTADFLNFYRMAFDQGDFREYHQWRYRSQKNYTPNYYALGYMIYGGLRYIYDYPYYVRDLEELIARRPYNIVASGNLFKKITGKRKTKLLHEIADTLNRIWRKDDAKRAPFIKSEQFISDPEYYTDYSYNFYHEGNIYSLRSGYKDATELVKITPKGDEEFISSFSNSYGSFSYHPETHTLWWNETSSDVRWSLKGKSQIWSAKLDKNGNIKAGSKKRYRQKGRLLYSPYVSADGGKIATIEMKVKGGTGLVVLSADNEILNVVEAHDSLQLLEVAWIGDDIYATALSDNGYGIYRCDIDNKSWETSLSPQPVKICGIYSIGEDLVFTCDRTGINEFYHYDTIEKKLYQKTVLKYGGDFFEYSPDGKWLYYTAPTLKGKLTHRSPVDSLINREVDFTDIYKYPIAEALTRQEKELQEEYYKTHPVDSIEISEPVRYRKIPNMFNLHSWAPFYVSVDNIMNSSYDKIYDAVSLGVTGLFQNRLSTFVGEVGYSAHKDPYHNQKWRHSGHAKLTYSGLYPVFELDIDFNDRAARRHSLIETRVDNIPQGLGIINDEMEKSPYLSLKLSTYIPFRFSSGGWYSGIIPSFSYSFTNDIYSSQRDIYDVTDPENIIHNSFIPGDSRYMQSISGSIRAYTSLSTPNSRIYPKWGFGLEIGARTNLFGHDIFSPMGYAYAYGYIPIDAHCQGVRFSGMVQHRLNSKSLTGQALVNVMPRGFVNSSANSLLAQIYPTIGKVTIDWAIPFYIGDWGIFEELLHIKRLSVIPHFDYSFFKGEKGKGLYSVGSDIIFEFNGAIWLDIPVSIGIRYSYNGGSLYDSVDNTMFHNYGERIGHHFVGPIFKISLP